MPHQRTLLDGDTGQKFDSLELTVGEALAGGGGGSITRLTTMWFIDPASTVPGPADGSIAKPYTSAQAAFAAFLTSALTNVAFVCAPGDLGILTIGDTELASKQLAIVGPANNNSNTAPAVSIEIQAGANDAAQLVCENLYISFVQTSGGGAGSGVYFTNCYLVDGSCGGWANMSAQNCFFVMGSSFGGPDASLVLQNCSFGGASRIQVGSSTSWAWDDFTERSYFRAGCFLFPGSPNLLTNYGSLPDAYQVPNADEVLTASGRRIVGPNTITADRNLDLTGSESARRFWQVDVYSQTFDYTIRDATSTVILYVYTAGGAAVRLFFGQQTEGDATVSFQYSELLQGA